MLLLTLIGALKKKGKKHTEESDESQQILPHMDVLEEPLPIRRKQTSSIVRIAKFFLPAEKKPELKQKKG